MARRANQRDRGRIRDGKITTARTREHPLRWVFEGVPLFPTPSSAASQVPMGMPTEMQQALAIHVFDNLHCSAPADDAVYELVRSAEPQPLGLGGVMWVPPKIASQLRAEQEIVDAVDPDTVPDIDTLDDAQLAVLEARIEARRHDEQRVAQLDQPIEAPPAPWLAEKEAFLDKLGVRLDDDSGQR